MMLTERSDTVLFRQRDHVMGTPETNQNLLNWPSKQIKNLLPSVGRIFKSSQHLVEI